MLRLIDLEVYKLALEIGKRVWDIVAGWDHFNKDTLGKQFVNAADSMALNITEGFGRFHYKENKHHNYFSRGSAFECTACLRKAFERKLISTDQNIELRQMFHDFIRLQNGYTNSIGNSKKSNVVNEDADYYESLGNSLENILKNDESSDLNQEFAA